VIPSSKDFRGKQTVELKTVPTRQIPMKTTFNQAKLKPSNFLKILGHELLTPAICVD